MSARALTITPVTLTEATSFVEQYHRHHAGPQGGLFAVAVSDGDVVRGVSIIGRPVSRRLRGCGSRLPSPPITMTERQTLRSAVSIVREMDKLLAREEPLYAGRKRVIVSARLIERIAKLAASPPAPRSE